jgi:hypothetical protein
MEKECWKPGYVFERREKRRQRYLGSSCLARANNCHFTIKNEP